MGGWTGCRRSWVKPPGVSSSLRSASGVSARVGSGAGVDAGSFVMGTTVSGERCEGHDQECDEMGFGSREFESGDPSPAPAPHSPERAPPRWVRAAVRDVTKHLGTSASRHAPPSGRRARCRCICNDVKRSCPVSHWHLSGVSPQLPTTVPTVPSRRYLWKFLKQCTSMLPPS